MSHQPGGKEPTATLLQSFDTGSYGRSVRTPSADPVSLSGASARGAADTACLGFDSSGADTCFSLVAPDDCSSAVAVAHGARLESQYGPRADSAPETTAGSTGPTGAAKAFPSRRGNSGAPYRPVVLPSSPDLFWSKVTHEPNTGCWLWMGARGGAGYGLINAQGHVQLAHRVSYAYAHGQPPAELPLDHRCRVRLCVNPQHLESVTQTENLARGHHSTNDRPRREVCSKGHPRTAENATGGKHPRCATCYREWVAANPEACRAKQERYRDKKRPLAAAKGPLHSLVLECPEVAR